MRPRGKIDRQISCTVYTALRWDLMEVAASSVGGPGLSSVRYAFYLYPSTKAAIPTLLLRRQRGGGRAHRGFERPVTSARAAHISLGVKPWAQDPFWVEMPIAATHHRPWSTQVHIF